MIKKIALFILSFSLIALLLQNNSTNALLLHTGRLRTYHLVIGAILIVVLGIVFVLTLDYLLSPKKKKKNKASKSKKSKEKASKSNNTGEKPKSNAKKDSKTKKKKK